MMLITHRFDEGSYLFKDMIENEKVEFLQDKMNSYLPVWFHSTFV